MSTLASVQRRFAAQLADDRRDTDGGVAVYRRTIRANYRQALAATYPVLRALTGASFFDALVDAYVDTHPSTSGDLNVYGASMGDFLDAYPHGRDVPYLPDVARLEWSIDESARAADATARPAEVFGALQRLGEAAVDARFALQPDARLLRSGFPVLRIWQRHQPGDDAHAPVDFGVGDDLLLLRRRDDGVQIERLAAGDHAWLVALAAGASLGEAVANALALDAAFDVAGALGARIADGTLDIRPSG